MLAFAAIVREWISRSAWIRPRLSFSKTRLLCRASAFGGGLLEVHDVTAYVGDFHIFQLWHLLDQPALLLGMDVLSQTRGVAIDYERHTVRGSAARWTERRVAVGGCAGADSFLQAPGVESLRAEPEMHHVAFATT